MKENRSTVLWTFLPFTAILINLIFTFIDPFYSLIDFESDYFNLFQILTAILRLIYYVGMSALVGIGFFKAFRNNNVFQYKLLKILLIIIAVCILIPLILYTIMPTSLGFILGLYGILFLYKRKKQKNDEKEIEAP